MIPQPQHYPYSGVIPNIVLDDERSLGLRQIMDIVCTFYEIPEKQIKGRGRYRQIVIARHVYCYLVRKTTRVSLKECGRYINRDHTSVIHGVQTIKDLMEIDPTFRGEVNLLESQL